MIHNLTSGGSGTSLNFKVVGGTTPPTSPKENTIWVNTDVAIPSWVFASAEPSPAEAGMVWISTGTISAVAFNALKKNDIQVYPLSAKQYVGSKWVSVEAKTYQGGQWVDWWDGHKLYSYGNQFEDVTGGWEIKNNTSMSTATVTFGDDGIAMNASNENAWVTTKNLIDLSGVVSLEVDVEEYESSGGEAYANIRVYEENFGWAQTGASYAAASALITKTGTTALDVTALTGSYYVTIRVIASAGYTQKIKFSEVRQV